jgi:hypothetical protein
MTATRKATTNATTKSTTTAKVVPITSTRKAAEPPGPEKPVRKSLPNAERRNETTHADGAAAVAGFACSACGAPKGTRCTAKSGEPTNHVHSARMKALDADPAPKPARRRKATVTK